MNEKGDVLIPPPPAVGFTVTPPTTATARAVTASPAISGRTLGF